MKTKLKTKTEFCENTIEYLNENFAICTQESAAKALGYKERVFLRKFREYFGVPFVTFLKKLQLHRAAQEICWNNQVLNVRKMTSFSCPQSFSKAFKAEMGVSPRNFLDTDRKIPDLFMHYQIQGGMVEFHYVETEPFTITSDIFHPESQYDEMEEWIGFWKVDELGKKTYHIGQQMEGAYDLTLKNEREKTEFPSAYYTVFALEKIGGGCDAYKIADAIRELRAYVFNQWLLINRRTICKNGQVFERYTKDKIYLYVPVFKNEMAKSFDERPEIAADKWIRYIDEHIKEDLSIKRLAMEFGYSERHFYDVFLLHFNILPGRYIEKRRLYLAAQHLQNEELTVEEVVVDYHFLSENAFRRAFFKAFKTEPENYCGYEYKVDNMRQYYAENKDAIRVRFVQMDSLYMVDFDAHTRKKQYKSEDLVEYITRKLQEKENEASDKVIVWKNMRTYSKCLIGPVIESEKDGPADCIVQIKGGKFAMIESKEESDAKNLQEAYQKLYRLAFAGWLWENWSKVDLWRLSYVKYCEGKLYFLIPIIE